MDSECAPAQYPPQPYVVTIIEMAEPKRIRTSLDRNLSEPGELIEYTSGWERAAML
jgi:hypothetical protein